MSTKKVSRRDFVKGSAMTATLAGISMPFNILAAGVSPNEKINLASIGMGSRASLVIAGIFANSKRDEKINRVAFCDPWAANPN